MVEKHTYIVIGSTISPTNKSSLCHLISLNCTMGESWHLQYNRSDLLLATQHWNYIITINNYIMVL